MKTIAVVQARMGSTRLPGKTMRLINGIPMIELLLRRLARAGKIDRVIVATSTDPANKPMVDYVKNLGYEVFEGSEHDVLDRFYQAVKYAEADAIVRITGDCPLIDPDLVDSVIDTYVTEGVDYASNTSPPTYPDGLDTEVFSFHALQLAAQQATTTAQREHVTPFLRESGLFSLANHSNDRDFSSERWTVDEPADLEVVARIFEHFLPRTDFNWREVLTLTESQPSRFSTNRHLTRNEGAGLGTGQKLWKRAKNVIPGGNMLLSKRAEMFLPEQWPTYFSRAKGCKVWDLDGNEYTDMSIMGIGTNTLGYGDAEVDDAVRRTVAAGNMSTFNCPEEVLLVERLIELHPWAQMGRLARTGGEADAISIRIGRAASGRDGVAICGYHGWHDWYLSANLNDDKGLDGHLLPGLEPNGVPRALQGTVFPFNYNDLPALEHLVQEHPIGVIMMEVVRSEGPRDNFLQKVRALATARGIVLIFDECTSGFRETFGGLHKKYGVDPDIAMFGKALGNGYAITAAIGRREVMEAAQTSFISSTFWTERIGPTAALQTLKVMERLRSWEAITNTGKEISAGWQALSEKYDLPITVSGLPSLTGFVFRSSNALAYKTLITQEMLSKGYLAGTSVYTCTEHTPQVVADFLSHLDPIFRLIRDCEDGRDISTLLKGPVCHAGFKRLN